MSDLRDFPSAATVRRIGVYGGAFDPPHHAHRALAQTALAQLHLDLLLILPTGQAWHKARTLTAANHRLALCQLAFGDLPRTQIDPREIQRNGPSYTVDTLQALCAEYPVAEFFLLLGADQLLAFKTWVRWPEVLQMVRLAVANRTIQTGPEDLHNRHREADLSHVDVPFIRLKMPLTNISATALRAQFRQTLGLTGTPNELVTPAVARYISHHHLYQHTT